MTTNRIVAPLDSWKAVRETLQREPAGTLLRVSKVKLPHPLDSGAEVTVSLPVGQSTDYRWQYSNGMRMYVRELQSHYEVRCEKLAAPALGKVPSPGTGSDPVATAAGYVALGALLGGLLGRSRASTLVGG